MSEHKIPGDFASALIDAAAGLAALQKEFDQIKFRACYRPTLYVDFREAKKLCKGLLEDLRCAEDAYTYVAPEQATTLRQVK